MIQQTTTNGGASTVRIQWVGPNLERLKELAAAGKTVAEMAADPSMKSIGATFARIRSALNDKKIPHKKAARGETVQWAGERLERLKELAKRGLFIDQIAAEMVLDYSQVYGALKMHRIAYRSRNTEGVGHQTDLPSFTTKQRHRLAMPTDCDPGTPEKIALMADRESAGLPIHHRDDCNDWKPTRQTFELFEALGVPTDEF